MDVAVDRLFTDAEATIGVVRVGSPIYFSLEDQWQPPAQKIPGETRIFRQRRLPAPTHFYIKWRGVLRWVALGWERESGLLTWLCPVTQNRLRPAFA